METFLYWLAHCNDNGFLSLILLTLVIINFFLGGKE